MRCGDAGNTRGSYPLGRKFESYRRKLLKVLMQENKTIKFRDKILENFHESWRYWKSSDYLYYVEKGGRNSAKSTHIAIFLVQYLMRHKCSALIIRKVSNTIEDSVFAQLR